MTMARLRDLVIHYLKTDYPPPVAPQSAPPPAVPRSLLNGLRLIDGLLSSGQPEEAQRQLRVLIVRWRAPQ